MIFPYFAINVRNEQSTGKIEHRRLTIDFTFSTTNLKQIPMDKSKVFFTNLHTTPSSNLLDKMERLIQTGRNRKYSISKTNS